MFSRTVRAQEAQVTETAGAEELVLQKTFLNGMNESGQPTKKRFDYSSPSFRIRSGRRGWRHVDLGNAQLRPRLAGMIFCDKTTSLIIGSQVVRPDNGDFTSIPS